MASKSSKDSKPPQNGKTTAPKTKERPKRHSRESRSDPVSKLLEELKLERNTCDLLLFGDGSGSTWKRAAGWATVALDLSAKTPTPEPFFGMINRGTVNFAEMMPYVHALSWFLAEVQVRRDNGAPARVHHVHIFTDSQYVAETGTRPLRAAQKKNRGLWVCLDLMARQGLKLNWHHIPRATHAFNDYVDALSRMARIYLEEGKLVEGLAETSTPTENWNLSDLMPK